MMASTSAGASTTAEEEDPEQLLDVETFIRNTTPIRERDPDSSKMLDIVVAIHEASMNDEPMSLHDLLQWSPPDEDRQAYENLARVLDRHYPREWRTLKLIPYSYKQLFGEYEDVTIRFAVPTVDLVLCFYPNATRISRIKLKGIKIKLLTWPIGRALIYAPAMAMSKMYLNHGFKMFHQIVFTLKAEFLSSAEVSYILGRRTGRLPAGRGAHFDTVTYSETEKEDVTTLTPIITDVFSIKQESAPPPPPAPPPPEEAGDHSQADSE